jgi:hypothetical protein
MAGAFFVDGEGWLKAAAGEPPESIWVVLHAFSPYHMV